MQQDVQCVQVALLECVRHAPQHDHVRAPVLHHHVVLEDALDLGLLDVNASRFAHLAREDLHQHHVLECRGGASVLQRAERVERLEEERKGGLEVVLEALPSSRELAGLT